MPFPIFIIKENSMVEKKIKNEEHYTAEWWRQKANLETIQQTAAKLYKLSRHNIVEKVSAGKYEIVRFMPSASFCENDIVAMLQ